MPIQAINNSTPPKRKQPNYVKWTGYGALGLGAASAIAGAKKKIKPHKFLAYTAGILAIIHTGIIEWHHFQRKNSAK
ncbi:MAG: hypothetical protein ACI37Q_08145 [Candidatus Gastranaerophilaceae bacterium]